MCCCNTKTTKAGFIAIIAAGIVPTILLSNDSENEDPARAPTEHVVQYEIRPVKGTDAVETQNVQPVGHYETIPANFAPTEFYVEGTEASALKTATFGAGCFWGVEATFRKIPGVTHSAVGFMGGEKPDPTYKEVCYTDTGHAEVIQVVYDPERVNYGQLLEVFWASHDPTQLNRQGPDIGSQYRTAVFFHDDSQRESATESMNALQATPKYAKRKIVTEITPAANFYIAEDYHQQYLQKRGLDNCSVP